MKDSTFIVSAICMLVAVLIQNIPLALVGIWTLLTLAIEK